MPGGFTPTPDTCPATDKVPLNTLWNKVWADLWLAKSRTWLTIINITVGLLTVGTLFGMMEMQLSKMDAAHQLSQPAHINLMLRSDVDLSLIPRIQALNGVQGIEALTTTTIRYKLADSVDWNTATLIIRPDFVKQQFDKTTLVSGDWPKEGTVAIENLSAKLTGINITDTVIFETTNGIQTLPINGIVRHPFIKPPKFGGQVHFFTSASNAKLFGIPKNSFRQLLIQIKPPYSADLARTLAGEITTLLTGKHIAVNATLLQDPNKHWGRPFLAGVNTVLEMMALSSLVLASVLIGNSASAHIAQQTLEIGVLKALGARRSNIIFIYMAETLIMAGIAICLALPLSFIGAYLSSCKILDLFNIACGAFSLPWHAISYVILGGLLVPLLASVLPILQGAAITVRSAIASYGLNSDYGYNRFDIWLEQTTTKYLPTLYATAVGNLFRRKMRFLLTQSVLIIAGMMFLVLMSLIASLNFTLDKDLARSNYSVRMAFNPDQPEQKILTLAESMTAIQKLEVWQRLPMTLSKNSVVMRQKGSLGAQLLALPAATQMYQPLIDQGRWFTAEDAGQLRMVLNADTAELNGIQVGDSVDVILAGNTQTWQVIGLYRWLAGNNFSVEPVYVPLETIRQINKAPALAGFALLKANISTIAEEADFLRLSKQIFQDQGIKIDAYNTLAKLEQRQFARNQFNSVIGTLFGLAVMIVAIGGIGLSGTLAIGVLQRTREIGVLRAIGASGRKVFQVFWLEGILHALIAWLIAVPLAYFAAEPLALQLGVTMLSIKLDFAFDYAAIVYWLGIVLVLAGLASYLPARRAAKLTVRECFGH